LHIDSSVLEMAEAVDEPEKATAQTDTEEEEGETAPEKKLSKKEQAELLRKTVDTIGQIGKPGEQIHKVISVGMLSEGWDAKTVTHIMGLRAFSSQLLCEQVVGRGLRRTSYEVEKDGLFAPEYVNIFGVPFTFLPHESQDGPAPPPSTPKTRIEPVPDKRQFEIRWPNIIRIEHIYHPVLKLEVEKVKPLTLDTYKTVQLVEMAPVVEGKPDITKISMIDLEELGKKYRLQKVIFETAIEVFDLMKPKWHGNRDVLLAQLIRLVETFLTAGKIQILPPMFNQGDIKQRIMVVLNMNKVVQHIWEAIRFENTEAIEPVFDKDKPIRATGDMSTWWTGRPCALALKSHINLCTFDSTWEASEAFELDRNKSVDTWVKNDHLGFEILYIFKGVVQKYRPDFIIRLKNGTHLVLEVKGQDTQQDRTKREFLDEWVRAVNSHGGFGRWQWAVSMHPSDVASVLQKGIPFE
jgi:type III restriction enzyme